jgi:peroxiredoxin
MTGKGRLALAVLGMFLAAAALGAPPKIGDPAPTWSGLPGTDGKEHSLSDVQKAKAIVVVFTCNHCPVAVAYEDRLVALQKDYQKKGVRLIAINCNTIAPDRLDKMKERAEQKGFHFPYLYDESQKTGHDYGATCTPHVFVLDKARKIAYMGAIDNSQNADNATTHYLRDALDALLAGKTPAVATTRPFGCGIRYEDK